MMDALSPFHRGVLIAHADDVATSLSDKCGRSVMGEPTYTNERGWHIEVVGLLDDILMNTVVVYPNGSRDVVA